MVTTQAIVDTMNAFDDAPVAIVAEPAVNVDVSKLVQETSMVPDVPTPIEIDTVVPEPVGNAEDESTATESGQREESAAVQEEEEDAEMPGLIDPEDDASDDEAEEEEEENRPQRSARVASGILKPSRYTMATKIIKQQSNSEERNAAIEKAESEEIELLFMGLRALQPVLPQELGDTKPLRCHMFTVEKFLADGSFDKVKTRMVAKGDEQDPQLYPDRSSPTVALHSIFACLAVAVYTRQYTVAKIDMKGAFIQMEMEGPPVFIRCDKKLTRLIVKLLPGIKRYVQKDGTLICRLLKALYGCVQASKLWFKKLSKFLQAEGYEPSPTDPCLMRKIVDGCIFLLLIYVDDILLFADLDEIKWLERVFY
jgi:hypothetical protein